VLQIGEKVNVRVLDIDRDRQRISLGLKQTQADPWQSVIESYQVGDVVEGRVTKVVTFGAFVEIHSGVEGLVHISELAAHHVENPREVVNQGDVLAVRVIEIDADRRRLSLSLKRVDDGDEIQHHLPDEIRNAVIIPEEIDEPAPVADAEDVEEPADEAVAEELVAEEAAVEEIVAEEIVAEEAAVEEIEVEEAAVEEIAAEEIAADEAVTDEAVTDEAVADEAVADEPVADETEADEPEADEPEADEPEA
jgi:small subunit ribosomal protein S1